MRPFGGFGIDGLVVQGEVPKGLSEVLTPGAVQKPPADRAGGGDAGPSATEPGYTFEPVGGFDRWPGGLKG